MKKYLHSYVLLALISGTIIILDQITKTIVRNNLELWTDVWSPWPWLTPYARILHVPNTGAAFGFFQEGGTIFKIMAIIVSLVIIYFYPQVPRSDWSLRIAMGLQLGGAVGNLIDRFTIGHVTDFISVGSFPVFNIADASITVGVGVLILGVWIQERQEKQRKQREEDNDQQIMAESQS